MLFFSPCPRLAHNATYIHAVNFAAVLFRWPNEKKDQGKSLEIKKKENKKVYTGFFDGFRVVKFTTKCNTYIKV